MIWFERFWSWRAFCWRTSGFTSSILLFSLPGMIKFKKFRVIHSWTLSKLKYKFSTEAKTFELDTPHFKSYIIRACSTCTVDVRYFPKWQLPKFVLAAVLSLKHVLATVLGPLAHPIRSPRPSLHIWEVATWEKHPYTLL